MTTTSSAPRWPIMLLATIGFIAALPFMFAFGVITLAITVGLAAKLFKVGIAVLAIWAIVSLFKAVFGEKKPAANMLTRIETVPSFDPNAEMEREKRAELARLDKELALALQKSNTNEAR